MIDRAGDMREATSLVERWIERIDGDGWSGPAGAAWNNKDLLGHLTAWSDLLIDQVEAFQQQRSDAIRAVNVDAWNAAQVADRKRWTSGAIVDDWRRAVRRAADVIEHVPVQAWSATWRVPWADRPVSIGGLLHLWLTHIEQHRARLLA